MLAVAAGLGSYGALRGSLPRYDGELAPFGLQAAVDLQRDSLGVVTVRASSVDDAAFGLGYVHAQERFFEMDLLRRSAAGELAELFGAVAVPRDRQRRLHRFRARAATALAQFDAPTRARLDAYVAGVNAGLADLSVRPLPYLLLRAAPVPWRTEDSLLAVYAMFFDLHPEGNDRELAIARVRRELPADYAAFVLTAGSEWDAPLTGVALPDPPLPAAASMDLRKFDPTLFEPDRDIRTDFVIGSNNWAVSGRHTAHGAALVANDMHLGLRVPNIWFRARLHFGSGADAVDVTGVSLPGTPGVIAGSNGRIAWGFTNSYGDWLDWVEIHFTDAARTRYRTAEGERAIETHAETIRVRDAPSETLTVRETVWGPIAHDSQKFGTLALAWTAHRPQALNFELLKLESAADVEQALDIANRSGVPAQNFVVGDRDGHIGWTIAGAIPRRQGFDAQQPADWSQPGVGWNGWLRPAEMPRIVDPANGRLWTANARVAQGDALAVIGDAGYDLGARARQIRDGLLARERFTPADMLTIQLDDRALLLDRWWRLLREVIASAGESAGDAAAMADLDAATRQWTGRAAVDSVDYRLVRRFRAEVHRRVVIALSAPLRATDPQAELPRLRHAEAIVWRLLQQRPAHLLAPRYADWNALLRESAAAVVTTLGARPGGLAARTWGEQNTSAIRHPLSRAVPLLAPLLDMPATPLPGDTAMPRVQGPTFGASERFAVAPGFEAEGYLHMPGGQSGHPLSPYYGAGHSDWEAGRATPFLPGPAVHFLRLTPAR